MQAIKLMADYHSPPLWWDGEMDNVGPIELDELPLSAALSADLDGWAQEFDATYHDEESLRFEWPSPAAHLAWLERGMDLTRRLSEELGAAASVRYFHGRELIRLKRLQARKEDQAAWPAWLASELGEDAAGTPSS